MIYNVYEYLPVSRKIVGKADRSGYIGLQPIYTPPRSPDSNQIIIRWCQNTVKAEIAYKNSFPQIFFKTVYRKVRTI